MDGKLVYGTLNYAKSNAVKTKADRLTEIVHTNTLKEKMTKGIALMLRERRFPHSASIYRKPARRQKKKRKIARISGGREGRRKMFNKNQVQVAFRTGTFITPKPFTHVRPPRNCILPPSTATLHTKQLTSQRWLPSLSASFQFSCSNYFFFTCSFFIVSYAAC